jgi:hypothetical protein
LDFDGSIYLESAVWRPLCLFEPELTAAQATAIERLRNLKHSEYFHADVQIAVQSLREFHQKVENDHLVFMMCSPVVFISVITFLVAVYLLIYIHCHGHLYRMADKFCHKIHKQGFKNEHLALTQEEWLAHIQAYDGRILGIWRGIDIAKEGIFSRHFWRQFFHGVVPIQIVSVFILYAPVLRGIMRPLTCLALDRKPDEYYMNASVDLQCYSGDNQAFVLAIFGLILWGVGLPLTFLICLRRNRHTLLNRQTLERWGFLYIGYELSSYYWEILILSRKALLHSLQLMASLNEESSTRLIFLLIASISLVMHLRRKPFDNRYDEILDTMEGRHLSIWVFTGLVLQSTYLVDSPNIVLVFFFHGIYHALFVRVVCGENLGPAHLQPCGGVGYCSKTCYA